jgi:hypothetical protein
MISNAVAVAMSFLALTTAASQPSQFDLICKGHSYMASWEAVDYGEVTTKVRVDTGSAKYCVAECEEIKVIEKITPDRIVFFDTSNKDGTFSQQFYDVARGQLIIRNGMNGEPPNRWVVSNDSECRLEKFSGFARAPSGERH